MLSVIGNEIITGLLVGPSVYFFTVLLSFFGYSFTTQFYDFMVHWGKDTPKLPLEFKLYPKVFSFLMVINMYIAFYSYAAAEELVHDTFIEGLFTEVRPIFIWFARSGIGG